MSSHLMTVKRTEYGPLLVWMKSWISTASRKNAQTSTNSRWAARYFRSDQVATANEPSRNASPSCCQFDSDNVTSSLSQEGIVRRGAGLSGAGIGRRDTPVSHAPSETGVSRLPEEKARHAS